MAVTVTLAQPPSKVGPVPVHQLDILTRMGIDVSPAPRPAALAIDALIGYGLSGHPTGRTAELIDWANGQGSPILALDVPSGLDATSGRAAPPSVRAAATLTLALPATGLLDPRATGDLFLADISLPPDPYR